MTEEAHRKQLQDRAMELAMHLAQTRRPPVPEGLPELCSNETEEIPPEFVIYVSRCCQMILQSMLLQQFLDGQIDACFRLLHEPDQAREIGAEGINKISAFLQAYEEMLDEVETLEE